MWQAIIAALTWLGKTAFTGATGSLVGTALLSGFFVLLARAAISLITFTVIYTATQAMMSFALSQSIPANVLQLMAQTGVATGLNILLSTFQAIISIRVIKISFVKT